MKVNNIIGKSGIGCMVLAALLLSFSGFSQNSPKKNLTADDYPLWSYAITQNLSENGKWVSFSLNYGDGKDSLFVKSTSGPNTYRFPGVRTVQFSGDSLFFCITPKRELIITQLIASKQETIKDVEKYNLSVSAKELIILRKGTDGRNLLEIRNLSTNHSIVLHDVGIYSYHPIVDAVAYTASSGEKTAIVLLDLRSMQSRIIASTDKTCKFSNIVWQQNGASIAFLQEPLKGAEQELNTSIGYYMLAENKLSTLYPERMKDFPIDAQINNAWYAKLSISQDGKRIFFGLKKRTTPVDNPQVQTWNTQDKALYPMGIQLDGWNTIAKVAVWWPQENRIRSISDNEFPRMMLSMDQNYAFLFNPFQHEPQAKREGDIDIYMMDLATGERKLVVQNQSHNGSYISAYEKHLVYFKNRNWWAYDMKSGLHKNLTKDLGVFFYDGEADWSEQSQPYGNPGWIEQDKAVLLYDKYDIWSISLDGSTAVRLTSGRENKTTNRIVVQTEDQSSNKSNYSLSYKGLFKPTDRLLIKTEASENTGYCFWDRENGLQPLLDKKMNTSRLLAANNNESYVYIEENFTTPRRILFKANRNSEEELLFQSNPQHDNYHWGASKRFSYTNSKGKVLNGILYYPANYHADTKYPMVVYVYEKLSQNLYNYVNPSMNNGTGFNVVNLTSKGYFVLMPDIEYEIGNPGLSATDCVVSATKKIIGSESVDRARIGLIGHSWGGYETDFIITQTNLFAAAVAGAAINNYVSSYLWVIPGYEKPNFYHAEYGQLRMGKSLYGDYAGYLRNSPIYHADKITTPLLSWAGEKDGQVDHYQSVEFHLALRRLGKTNTMLIYPGENHVLSNPINQQDLTGKIEDWFDHYLKGDKKPAE